MPNQEVQEQMLKAVVEGQDDDLAAFSEEYGPIDSEKLAADLQDARTYADPETPRRIAKILQRKDRRLQTVQKIFQSQEANAAEDGTGHGYKGKVDW